MYSYQYNTCQEEDDSIEFKLRCPSIASFRWHIFCVFEFHCLKTSLPPETYCIPMGEHLGQGTQWTPFGERLVTSETDLLHQRQTCHIGDRLVASETTMIEELSEIKIRHIVFLSWAYYSYWAKGAMPPSCAFFCPLCLPMAICTLCLCLALASCIYLTA